MEKKKTILERAEDALRERSTGSASLEEIAGVVLRVTQATATLTGSTGGKEMAVFAACCRQGKSLPAALTAYLIDRAPAVLKAAMA